MTPNISALIAEVHTLLGTPSDKWAIGAWNVGRSDSPGRFVWVPTISAVEPPRQASNQPGSHPRNIYTHRMTVEVHIWGETLDETVEMMHGVLAAVRQVARVATWANTGRWDNAQLNERGYLMILPVEFPLVVTDEAINQTTIATITTIECDDDGDPPPPPGWIDCPC